MAAPAYPPQDVHDCHRRPAKQEKTKVVVQGSCHLPVDEEYLDNRPPTNPLCVPMCHKGNKGTIPGPQGLQVSSLLFPGAEPV